MRGPFVGRPGDLGGSGILGAGNGYMGQSSRALFLPEPTRSCHCDLCETKETTLERKAQQRTLDSPIAIGMTSGHQKPTHKPEAISTISGQYNEKETRSREMRLLIA